MEFVKMEGLGNDFVVIEGPRDVSSDEVAAWCDRRHGIGADGVLVVTPVAPDRIAMHYRNADGSAAEMCGNGLRCVARFGYDLGWVSGAAFMVETAVGDLPVEILADGNVRALLGTPGDGPGVAFEHRGHVVHPVSVGNPHAVILVDDPATAPVTSLGPELETDARFAAGTNVEFAAVVAPDRVRLRVWERGVGETLACGTGAAATAYLVHREAGGAARTTVELPGGELVVDLDRDGAWIEGPARTVFCGTWG